MSDNTKKEYIGAIVKARTLAPQKTSSNLARRAIQEIERLTTDPHVSELIRQMGSSSDWKDQEHAWIELRKMGPTYRGWAESLRNAIYTGNGWARIEAAEILAMHRCNPDDAVPVLVTLLKCCLDESIEDESIGVNSQTRYIWARVACGAIGKYQCLTAALKEIAIPALLEALDSSDYNVSGYAAETLSQFGNDALCAIPKIAAVAKTKDDWLKNIFWTILRKFHPSIEEPIDALLLAAFSPDPKVRVEAVCEIAKFGFEGVKAIPQLLSLRNDENCDVKRFLAITLGKLGERSPTIIDALNILTNDPDDSVKLGAFYALVCLGESQISNLHRLLQFLSHGNPFVRYLSAWSVGEVGFIDRENTISCLTSALRREEYPQNKKLISESLKKVSKF
jgi:HEAT repeat protein